ncbi:MAG: tyrosine-type recombinase/integrase [Candidatus Thiodiazotropha sp. (ex. Lucinisca nassula)]|nr:tyrosine-type recombinase/integrase [Candidatus Thiodiazotropha sp. (ex. Lucinisca nassula)]
MPEKVKLTKRVVDAAKPPEDPNTFHQVWDIEIPGYGLRITHAGVKSYILSYRFKGRQRKYTIGRHGDYTAETARAKALDLRAVITKGGDPQAEKHKANAIPSLSQFADEYLAHIKKTNKTWNKDASKLNKRILPKWGKLRLDTLTTRQIESFHSSLKTERTPATTNRYLALIKRMLNLAVEWGYIDKNPAQHIKLFKENNERTDWLNNDQIKALVTACSEYGDQYIAALFPFLLYTGARLGEALNAQWSSIDIDRGMWHIPEAKSGKGRYVPIAPQAIQLLKTLKQQEGNPYVFCGRVKGQALVNVAKPWKRIKAAANLPDHFRIHDLRHTFASWGVSHGIDLYHIQALLGHSSAQMTQRYSHLAEDGIKASVKQISEKMGLVD